MMASPHAKKEAQKVVRDGQRVELPRTQHRQNPGVAKSDVDGPANVGTGEAASGAVEHE
jgi:hypothetical protein